MNDLESTLAIDFGTTNSVVFVYKSGKLEAVPAGTYNTDKNQQGSTLFPSYVEYSKNGVIVGGAAKNNFGRNNKFVVAAVKRIIGLSYTEYENLQEKSIFGCEVINGQDGYPKFVIDAEGNTKSPVEVASEIFKVLKKEADAYTNRSYSKAYVTVPANFKDHQCRAIKEAAKLAGLEVLKLIKKFPGIKVPEIVEKLRIKDLVVNSDKVRNEIKRNLFNYIEYKGSNKTGGYYLK